MLAYNYYLCAFEYNAWAPCAQISKHIGMLATGMLGERAVSAWSSC